MNVETVCPFFRKGDDFCDVGISHISPHDVTMIIAYCNSRFGECAKYRELSLRFPELALPQKALPTPNQAEAPAEPLPPAGRRGSSRPEVSPFRVRWPLPFQMRYTSAYCSTFYGQNTTKEEKTMTTATVKNRGWTVALAGTGINLALGVLYTWSIFKDSISQSINSGGAFAWDPASINDPYAVCCLVFAFAMILAGKCQDKFGPRLTAVIGGLMVGAGFLWISQTTNYWAWVVGFGVLTGAGIGFGYSAATPPALKWFPPAKTGLIAGIVVSGFGLASVYIAPLATYLVGTYGLQSSMLILGISFTIVVSALAMLISNPPKGFVHPVKPGSSSAPAKPVVDYTPTQLFSQGKFYILWITFFIGAGAGLMVIGSVAGMAKASLGEMAFVAVAIMAIGNAGGRIVAGVLSDKIGRANTLVIMMAFQALLMFAAIPVIGGNNSSAVLLVLLATFIGFNYGTNLALFPSFAKDLWGMKNYGVNYGLLFTSWGIGAFVLVRVAEMLKVKFGSFTPSFAAAGVLLLVGAMLAMSLRPRKSEVAVTAPAAAPVEEEELVLQKID